MFNATFTENGASSGFGTLELVVDRSDANDSAVIFERPPRPEWTRTANTATHAPLERTELRGTITGPLASLRLVQRFRMPPALVGQGPIEARYRFPLPGDAAVIGVVVRFGDVEVRTTLAERDEARATYNTARAAGHQAALLEREAANVFTLSLAGLRDAEAVEVETRYVQRALLAGGRWSLRVPLTTPPRFTRADEAGLPQVDANPLATLRDPGHRFALDVTLLGADGALAVASPTHALNVVAAPQPSAADAMRVRLADGEVVPDRDCVLTWRPAESTDAQLYVSTEDGERGAEGGDDAFRYALVLVRPPAAHGARPLPRDLVILADRSGSMGGAKWEATRWAIRRLLAGLGPDDRVQLGLFDDRTVWLGNEPLAPGADTRDRAEEFLETHGPHGGTQLGTALEAALLTRPRARGAAVARHCLVLTDGQVTDEGRILNTLDQEGARPDARRTSVLCIDSAPNASLATAVAARGRGTAHFLSSDSSDGDVATALEDVLDGFDAPLAVGLTLEINRPDADVSERGAMRADGVTRVDMGDLVTGRPAWVVIRLPAASAPGATLRVSGHGIDPLSGPSGALDATGGGTASGGAVRAAFGAGRVRVLEQLAAGGADVATLRARVRELGYDPATVGLAESPRTVYAENAGASPQASHAALRALIARESLDTGVPSTATAFVAVREVAGQAATRTIDVACALPAGWSSSFDAVAHAAPLAGGMVMASPAFAPQTLDAPPMPAFSAFGASGAMASLARRARAMFEPSAEPATRSGKRGAGDRGAEPPALWKGVPVNARDGEIVLYDSADAPDGGAALPEHIARLVVRLAGDAQALAADTRLLIYVGDLAQPVARVELRGVLAAGGVRPLNVRRARGMRVRLVLEIDGAAWPSAAGALTVTLGA